MKKFLIACVVFYRKHLSPLKKPCCRFTPTCSAYAIDALEEWGALKGSGLAVWRILRCNPFCRGGIDKVPVNPRRIERDSRIMTAGKIVYRGRK